MGNTFQIDMRGKKYGRLTAVEYLSVGRWLFRCDCGKMHEANGNSVRSGKIRSCGCYQKDYQNSKEYFARTHYKSKSPTYRIWIAMKSRCNDPKTKAYKNYGGRGIKVCDRWMGKSGFVNFLADMGERPSPKHSIDRINGDGDYCPENCRWATSIEQNNNLRRNVRITHNGVTHTIAEWCRIYGVNRENFRYRLSKGMDFERVIAKGSVQQKLLTDDEVRYIRSHPQQYEHCVNHIGKQFSRNLYNAIIRRDTYVTVI